MARAAQYGPAPVPDLNGNPLPGVAVTVTTQAANPIPGAPIGETTQVGIAAVLYTDISGATAAGSNVVNADSSGNVTFFAPPGQYLMSWPASGGISTLAVTAVASLTDPALYVSDDATKGIVLKDANGHYWRVTVSIAGALVLADLGTSRPAA